MKTSSAVTVTGGRFRLPQTRWAFPQAKRQTSACGTSGSDRRDLGDRGSNGIRYVSKRRGI